MANENLTSGRDATHLATAPGETILLTTVPLQAARWQLDGVNLVARVPGERAVVIDNFLVAAISDNPPVMVFSGGETLTAETFLAQAFPERNDGEEEEDGRRRSDQAADEGSQSDPDAETARQVAETTPNAGGNGGDGGTGSGQSGPSNTGFTYNDGNLPDLALNSLSNLNGLGDDGLETPFVDNNGPLFQFMNTPPVAVADGGTFDEDTVFTLNVLDNDTDADGHPLTLVDVSTPGHGTVTFLADGTVVYTPDAHYSGPDEFRYVVTDGHGASVEGHVSLTITPVADAPDLIVMNAVGDEDTAIPLSVQADLVDRDGSETLSVRVTGAPSGATVEGDDSGGGTISALADGIEITGTVAEVQAILATLSVTPPLHSDADFTLTVTATATETGNNDMASTVASIDVTVVAVADAPTLVATSTLGNEDTAIPIDLDIDFVDADGSESMQVVISGMPAGSVLAAATTLGGTLVDNGNDTWTIAAADQAQLDEILGSLTVTPPLNHDQDIALAFTATTTEAANGDTASTTGIALVNVVPQPDPPVALDDGQTTNEDVPITVSVLTNDSDPDGNTLTVIGAGGAGNGSASVNGDGTVTYTPAADFHGVDTFTYTVDDGTGLTDSATVTVTVNPVNDTPTVPVPATASGAEDAASIQIDLTGVDVDGGTGAGDAVITHFTVTQLPDAAEGQLFTDAALTAPVAANSPIAITAADTLTLYFVPAADYHGTANFAYRAVDGDGAQSGDAVASVTVTPVNDPPTMPAPLSTATAEDTGIVFALTADDVDGGTGANDAGVASFTVTALPAASEGTLYMTDGVTPVAAGAAIPVSGPQTVSLLFVPAADFNGTAQFTYVASDAAGADSAPSTGSITVTPVNDAPFVDQGIGDQITAEDAAFSFAVPADAFDDVDTGDTMTLSATRSDGSALPAWLSFDPGTQTFSGTPDNDDVGSVQIRVVATDAAGATAETIFGLTVTNVNDPPVAADDSGAITEDAVQDSIIGNVLSNDADVDNTPAELTVSTLDTPSYGTLLLNADGSFLYTLDNGNAAVNALGPADTLLDTITYTVDDGAATATASLTITITGSNDAPTAAADTATTAEDSAVTVSVFTGDSDPEGGPLTVTGVSGAANGTANILDATAGTVEFLPDPDFNGDGGFTYTIDDGTGLTATASVTVTVTPENDAPVAAGDLAATETDTSILFNIVANDSDADGDALTVTGVTQPANGTALDNGDGTLTYHPDPGYDGIDSLTYTVSDGSGATASATVTVFVGNTVFGTDAGEAVAGTLGTDIIYGFGGADTLTGDAGDDLLIGGAGADSLSGGSGADTLEGGAGADTLDPGAADGAADQLLFDFDALDGTVDTVTNFETGAGGDVLNVGDVLIGYTAGNESDFINIVDDGTDTTVQIDVNGMGAFSDLVILSGITGVAAADLLTDNMELNA